MSTETWAILFQEPYNALAAKVQQDLANRFPMVRVSVPRQVADKNLFTSLELVMGVSPESVTFESMKATLISEFCTGRPQDTGDMLRVMHECHSVEITFTPPEHFDTMLAYLSYGGAGELLGRVAKAYSMALTGRGLAYRAYDRNRLIAELDLADSWTNALSVLGYDPAIWAQGFDSESAVFEFVRTSPLFSAEKCFPRGPSTDGYHPLCSRFRDWLEAQSAYPDDDALTYLFARVPGFQERYKAAIAADKAR